MNLRSVRRVLSKEFPIQRRVVVSIDDDLGEDAGACELSGQTIVISIAPMSDLEQSHTLAHEWAHARIFDKHGKQRNRHTREWVAEYARIYRRLFE